MSISPHPRLIFVTGKGGVGKSSLAFAYCYALKQRNQKVFYNCFDQIPNYHVCKLLNIEYLELDNIESAKQYIEKKIGNATIAKWIMKTPFFSSLFNILPGFSMLIILGHIIELLEKDPSLHIVVDSPSSGHALTMLESTHNFKKIFGSGKLVDDINRMHKFLYDQKNVKMIITALPTEMAIQEAEELNSNILNLGFHQTQMYLNDVYSETEELHNQDECLPSFLLEKIANEKSIISKYAHLVDRIIPHLTSLNNTEAYYKAISTKIWESKS